MSIALRKQQGRVPDYCARWQSDMRVLPASAEWGLGVESEIRDRISHLPASLDAAIASVW